MSILKSRGLVRDETTFEIDMRNLLQRKKQSGASNKTEETGVEVSSLVSQISGQSVLEIDHLIEGLQGVRKKLDDEGERIQRDIGRDTWMADLCKHASSTDDSIFVP